MLDSGSSITLRRKPSDVFTSQVVDRSLPCDLKTAAMRQTFFVLALLCLPGCAAVNFGASVEIPGQVSDTRAISERAERMSGGEAADVKVYFGEMPAGLALDQNGLTVQPGYTHQVVGKVSVVPKMQNTFAAGFYDYVDEQEARSYACAPQTVLVYLTLFTWVIVPTYYPCIMSPGGNDPDDIADRKARILTVLQKAARASGGDAVLLSSLGRLVTVQAGSGATLGTTEMMGAEGFIVKLGGAAPPPASAVQPAEPAVTSQPTQTSGQARPGAPQG